jgi:hypothetical protein
MADKVTAEPRDRQRPLKAFVSPQERETVAAKAAEAGLTLSAYLRAAALGTKIESAADQRAILALLQINADQGRLGGLLKLWLVSKAGQGASPGEIRHLLRQIESLQIKLRALIDSL